MSKQRDVHPVSCILDDVVQNAWEILTTLNCYSEGSQKIPTILGILTTSHCGRQQSLLVKIACHTGNKVGFPGFLISH